MTHNIEEDGQSCIQEVCGNFGPNTTSAVEKYLYTHKWRDGQTRNGTQILDSDISYWTLLNDDYNINNYDMWLIPIRENEFL